MTGDWPAAARDVPPLGPSGPSTAEAELSRGAAERDADLRAERWLLVREVVILVAISVILVALRQ